MLRKFVHGVVVLGGAAIVAVSLYWLSVLALGVDHQSVFQGGLLAAGTIGLACLAADSIPRAG